MTDVELNSIGNGDGNNYLLRDNSKIPLTGSNQISGDLIPATTDSVNLGSSVREYLNAYIKSLTINGVACGDILTHNASEFVPRSGGAVFSGSRYSLISNKNHLEINGGTDYGSGSSLVLTPHASTEGWQPQGSFVLHTNGHNLIGYPNGTLTWDGQAIQTVSDQRLKQQIAEIDDALLDAWEDVDLVQFKYNDAVEEKSDSARLHTGYVVQQIDDACKSHGVDVSKYGLYCHEEYAEETREVEHEDGTKTIEVVRPASEHYSLRYTEALIVECAYLRKKNKDLQEQLNALSERLEKLENR